MEPKLALVGLHRVHGLVPDDALEDCLVVVDGGQPAQRAARRLVASGLLDPKRGQRARAQKLLVAVPGDVGLRVAALRQAAQLVLLGLARGRGRGRHDCGRLRRD